MFNELIIKPTLIITMLTEESWLLSFVFKDSLHIIAVSIMIIICPDSISTIQCFPNVVCFFVCVCCFISKSVGHANNMLNGIINQSLFLIICIFLTSNSTIQIISTWH